MHWYIPVLIFHWDIKIPSIIGSCKWELSFHCPFWSRSHSPEPICKQKYERHISIHAIGSHATLGHWLDYPFVWPTNNSRNSPLLSRAFAVLIVLILIKSLKQTLICDKQVHACVFCGACAMRRQVNGDRFSLKILVWIEWMWNDELSFLMECININDMSVTHKAKFWTACEAPKS